MKKVFLHGELGVQFGESWELSVSSPMEVLQALFANNGEIEKYIYKKAQDNITYGAKYEGSDEFIKEEEASLTTSKNIHIFPIPSGSGFVGSLVMTAASTAISVWISKKMSETFNRDESVTQNQSQSFLLDGGDNRFKQGSTIPLGYGRVKVGSNVVSFSTANYEYDSSIGAVTNFNDGLIIGLVPEYSEFYDEELGVLLSTLMYDGNQANTLIDPNYERIKKLAGPSSFGTIDNLYGKYVPAEQYKNYYTNAKSGNSWSGWVHYDFNFAKGLDKSRLQNWTNNGQWYPSHLLKWDEERKSWYVPAKDIQRSSVVASQSMPALENTPEAYDPEEKKFYPILFEENNSPPSTIENKHKEIRTVGTRWLNGEKKNGGNWHKFESVTIFKAIDLLCEGPIEGFCDKNGETKKFRNRPQLASNSRNDTDDFLQGVYLDEIPVKEIESVGNSNFDSYNVNEFDIDVSIDENLVIGSDDQNPLGDRYKFTSNTKEINATLYGPRTMNPGTVLSTTNNSADPFEPGKAYVEDQYFRWTDEENGEELIFSTTYDLSTIYNDREYYETIAIDPDRRFYTTTPYQIVNHNKKYWVPYHGYNGGLTIDDYRIISGEGVYAEGDKARCIAEDGLGYKYFSMGSSADKFVGLITKENYQSLSTKVGSIFMAGDKNSDPDQGTSTSSFFIITGLNQDMVNALPEYETQVPGEVIGAKIKTLSQANQGKESFDHHRIFSDYRDNKMLDNGGFVPTEAQIQTIEDFVGPLEDIGPQNKPSLWREVQIVDPFSAYIEASSTDEYAEELDLLENGNVKYYLNISDSIFQVIGSSDNKQALSNEEEYYIAHTIINPDVRQAVVTLQIDQLYFIYPGDDVEVTYEVGDAWAWITGALTLYHGFMAIRSGLKAAGVLLSVPPQALTSAQHAESAIKHGLQAVFWGTATYFIADGIFIKMGTKIENSGEFWPNRAMFRIKYGNENETMYSTDLCFHGVCTSSYRKDIKIFLPDNPENKDRTIKVYKLNRERNPVVEGEMAVRYKNKMSINSISEITPTVLSYPNSVVVGTRMNARDMGRVPTRSYDLKLKKVRVPSNYHTERRTYTGFWDGLFKGQEKLGDEVLDIDKEWTDNPAWCLYDLISNKSYGVGRFGINFENIDRWTLYKIAKYCDEYVSTGYASKFGKKPFKTDPYDKTIIKVNESKFVSEFYHLGKRIALFFDDGTMYSSKIVAVNVRASKITLENTIDKTSGECAVEFDQPLLEPRYTVNALLTTEQNAFNLINQFCNIFRAFAYWNNGAIHFFQDDKKDPLMFFHNGNISDGGFSYIGTPRTERINTCKVRYFDKYNKFRPKLEFSEDKESVDSNNIIETTLDGFGITSKSQAKRAADFLIKSSNLETELVTFKTSIIGSYLKPGDVIEVLDKKRTIGRCAGKISDLRMDPEGRFMDLYLDYPVNIKIEASDRSSWKKIKVYNLSEFETIQTLNEIAGSEVDDEKIDDLRKSQMTELTVNSISKNREKLRVLSPKYEVIDGEYTFTSAFYDAKKRDGTIAGIGDESDQEIIETMLQDGDLLWLGGAIKQLPPPEELLWLNAQGCSGFNVDYGNWLEGYPPESLGVIDDPIIDGPLTEQTIIQENDILTDNPGYTPPDIYDNFTLATDPNYTEMLLGSDFMCITGSSNVSKNGKWLTMPSGTKMGYILERQLEDNAFEDFINLRNKSFMIEEETEMAIPKKYRITNIKEETNGIYMIEASEYHQEKYDNIEKSISMTPPTEPNFYTEKMISNHKSVEFKYEYKNNMYKINSKWQTTEKPAYFRVEYMEYSEIIVSLEIPRTPETEEYEHEFSSSKIKDPNGIRVKVYSIY